MRFFSWMLAAGVGFGGAACSWTSDGGFTGRYVSDREYGVESAPDSWDGSPIRILNDHGGVRIVGVPGATNLRVEARMVAGANSQADADAAFADVAEAFHIEKQDGVWTIECPQAQAWHGSVDPASTGCDNLRVEVPAGAADAPLEITGSVDFGGFHVSGVTVKTLDLQAPFGIIADVTPSQDAEIRLWGEDLVMGNCSSILRVPPETTIASAHLTVDHADATYVGVSEEDPEYRLGAYVEGFADAPDIAPRTGDFTWQRGTAPFSMKRVELRASLGRAVLTTLAVPAYDALGQCEHLEIEASFD